MTTLKPYLQIHSTGKEAIKRTIQKNVIAVCVKTYVLDTLHSTEFYTYKTNGKEENLYEDFPISLSSNQTIEEIDSNDY